ncbi:uncharacterized protein LOC107992434 isoform X2 [Apis cerana]|uniref:uncharacterized protein LOC107992434 isoform X2 n=1 Tax=Apis cerana TaxID=7461 RepID=UPI002B225E93|nr:uncharacterized protein LOC107992434 isoform X2 [Apis cerana]
MLKTLCKLYTFKIKKNLQIILLQKCFNSTINVQKIFKNNLQNSIKYENKILKIINNNNLKDLTKYIHPTFAETIISSYIENGPYKSLNDLLIKTNINENILNEFYNSILNHEKIPPKKINKFTVTPNISGIKMPQMILGIHVGPNAISWTLLNSNFKILNWDCLVWRNKTSKITTYDIISSTSSFVQELPISNNSSISFVMEEIDASKMLCYQFQIIIGVASCLKLLLCQEENNSSKFSNNLYILKPRSTARFFKLRVGNETIAANYILEKILNKTNETDENLKQIQIYNKIKKKYMEKIAEEKEQIGWSLLTALTFVHLVKDQSLIE